MSFYHFPPPTAMTGRGARYSIEKNPIGGEAFQYSLHRGVRLENNEPLLFVKVISLCPGAEKRLAKMAAVEVKLSDDAVVEQIVRYRDFIPPTTLVIEPLPVGPNCRTWTTNFSDGLTDAETIELAWDILKALAYLHGRGIVHGDVRPCNIIRDDAGYRLIGHGLGPGMLDHGPVTHDSVYSAPEMLGRRGCRPTAASDMWMLGVVLRECHSRGAGAGLRGRNAATAARGRLAEHLFGTLEVRPEGCDDGSHFEMDAMLERMLVRKPRGRVAAADMLESLLMARRASNVELAVVKRAARRARKEVWRQSFLGRAVSRVQVVVGTLLVTLWRIL